MKIIHYFYNFILAAMIGITILGLSSNTLLGVTGSVFVFIMIMGFGDNGGRRYFNRRI